ncbi:Mur ligase, central [Dillenia turbinata]|uniref:Mur ligase, central n=1 Tax=Dillenia turbinata TaxID=194707 RepID=A0AAN8ZPX5_9MAGN
MVSQAFIIPHETLSSKFRALAKMKMAESPTVQSSIHKHDLQGQSVAIVGLGKSGMSAARLALARGASVLAVDQNENLIPLEQNRLFEKHNGLKTVLGDFDCQLLKDVDVVVVSPGVALENYGLSSLLQSGSCVMSELDFAAEVLPKNIKMLAVTGTNGKSTVTTFAGQMLHHLNIDTFVGGNLGEPLSEAALQYLSQPASEPKFQAVVEVSSYQLEIPSNFFSPSVAVILNITPDHLERHKTMENYASTKCRLFSLMSNGKMGVLPHGSQLLNKAVQDHVNHFSQAWIGDFPGVKVDMETKVAYLKVPETQPVSQLHLDALKAMGAHNYQNAAVAALCVLGLDIGIDAEALGTTIGKLSSPPHRMQFVCTDCNGITWLDDSKATNVEATYAGLMGLKDHKSVILLGGLAKVVSEQGSIGFEQLVAPLNNHKGVVTETLSANGLSIPSVRATNLKDAVTQARSMATYGDRVVLSPGCASFDEFKNFEHRGRVFEELALSSK